MQIGPYTVIEGIGQGGMGLVYRAQGPDGKDVALKLLQAQRALDPRAQRRFKLEVQALARLRHPNVVAILGAGEHQGSPWMALEYVQGQSLDERLRVGPLSIDETLEVGEQLARALAYVHSCGLLHRDLKPGNVLLRGGKALLTDFGMVLDDESSRSRFTATGAFYGTPGFWAPEQARGETAAITPATDVYGLGALLYACLTGRPPVQAPSLQAYLEAVSFQSIEPPRESRPEIPAWLSELCMRCLAFEPGKRPSSPTEVAAALLAKGARGEPTQSAGRGRATVLAVGAGALVVTGLVALGWWSRGDSAEPTPTSTAVVDSGEGHSSAEQREQALQLLASGLESHGAGHYAEAFTELNRALELDPNLAEAYLGRAEAERMLELPTEALEDYARALELDPSLAKAHAGRGDVLRIQDRWEEALIDFERALELEPDYARAYVGRGGAQFGLQRFAEAVEDLERALELGLPPQLETEVVKAREHAARMLTSDGPVSAERQQRARKLYQAAQPDILGRRFGKALESLDRVVEMDPRFSKAYGARGTVKAMQGRNEEALADFTRAIKLNPSGMLHYAKRGDTLAKLGRNEEALDDYDYALANGLGTHPAAGPRTRRARDRVAARLGGSGGAAQPVSEPQLNPRRQARALVMAGQAKARAGRHEEAIADYDRALELDPRSIQVHTKRGDSNVLLRRHAEAVEDYSRAIDLSPRLPLTWLSRGLANASLERHEEALADFDRALELNPSFGRIYTLRGSTKAKLGRLDEALEDFERAWEFSEEDTLTYVARAAAYSEAMRLDEALADAERLLELDPDSAQAHLIRGVIRVRQERYAEALPDVERALELEPHMAEAHARQGSCMRGLERYAEAVAAYDRALELGLTPGATEEVRAARALAAAKLDE